MVRLDVIYIHAFLLIRLYDSNMPN